MTQGAETLSRQAHGQVLMESFHLKWQWLERRLLQDILQKYNYPELFSSLRWFIYSRSTHLLNSCYVPGTRLWRGPEVLPFGISILSWLLRNTAQKETLTDPLFLRDSEGSTYSRKEVFPRLPEPPNLNWVWQMGGHHTGASLVDPISWVSLFLGHLADIYLPRRFHSSSTTCKLPTSFKISGSYLPFLLYPKWCVCPNLGPGLWNFHAYVNSPYTCFKILFFPVNVFINFIISPDKRLRRWEEKYLFSSYISKDKQNRHSLSPPEAFGPVREAGGNRSASNSTQGVSQEVTEYCRRQGEHQMPMGGTSMCKSRSLFNSEPQGSDLGCIYKHGRNQHI